MAALRPGECKRALGEGRRLAVDDEFGNAGDLNKDPDHDFTSVEIGALAHANGRVIVDTVIVQSETANRSSRVPLELRSDAGSLDLARPGLLYVERLFNSAGNDGDATRGGNRHEGGNRHAGERVEPLAERLGSPAVRSYISAVLLPRFIAAAAPVLRDAPPTGRLWTHEVKFDGWRVQESKPAPQVAPFFPRRKFNVL